MIEHNRTALVIGATGGIGRAVAAALAAHGWNVRGLHRDPDRARAASPDLAVTLVRGDAMHEADVVAAAKSASILFHGANPPGYRRWRELAIPMLANAITAARASGARLVFPDVGHAWAYLPDLAETVVRLAEIEQELGTFEVFHFGGHWIEPGVEICHAVRRAAGKPDLPIRSFPWIAVYLASPFSAFMRELLEMRYLWRVPLRLDNRKLVSRLGEEPHTPLDEAVALTLASMGTLAN
jgi:nucleoside-diphosphate-sugar epimerase